MSIRWIWVCVVVFWSSGLIGGTLESGMDRKELFVNEPAKLTVRITGEYTSPPEFPETPGVRLLNVHGPMVQRVVVNGREYSFDDFVFEIAFLKEGQYTLPSLAVTVDGEQLNTEPMRVRVAARTESEKLFFLRSSVPKTSLYVGESTIEYLKVYSKHDLRNQSFSPLTSDLIDAQFLTDRPQVTEEIVDGERWFVYVYKRLLKAFSAGTGSLPETKFSGVMLVPRRQQNYNPNDIFSEFRRMMRGAAMQKQVFDTIPARPMTVMSLPPGPPNFKGVIGDFSLRAELGQSQLEVGETTTLTIVAAGLGRLAVLDEMDWNPGDGFKIYPDKPLYEEQFVEGQGFQSRKTFKYALVPTRSHSGPLPEISLPVFDPETGTFKTLTAEPLEFLVTGTASEDSVVVGAAPRTAGSSKKEVKQLALDIVDLKRRPRLSGARLFTVQAVVFVGLAALPWIIGVWIFWRDRRSLTSGRRRRQRAGSEFEAMWKTVQPQLSSEPGAVLQIDEAFRSYIGLRFGKTGKALTSPEIVEMLRSHGSDISILQGVTGALVQVDKLRFGGKKLTATDAENTAAGLLQVVKKLEASK